MRYEIITYSEIQVGDQVLDGQSVKSVARVVPATNPHHYAATMQIEYAGEGYLLGRRPTDSVRRVVVDDRPIAPDREPAAQRLAPMIVDRVPAGSVHLTVTIDHLKPSACDAWIAVDPEGTVHLVRVEDHCAGASGNPYIHIDDTMPVPASPTEAQRRRLARWWLGLDRDHPLSGPVGSSVCQWAFSSLDPQEISRLYGDGSPVYLA